MRLWEVNRKDNSAVIVGIFPHKLSGKFSFINFTKEHICPCQFDSIEDAIHDMDTNPNVLSYKEVERSELLIWD